ncbi:uncharacterized protein LOC133818498 [Humulus lupulus]|uniref:uncharacterized protein LOC133818498 n=1 Tax=Humulus lupulus TaxID=3486 RepID=UPI002B40E0D7|nr:uncharacterized protein LOC133818498 [Humulus lupulus]
MAIELCSEKSPGMVVTSNGSTPRISFSYDFLQSDVVPIEQRPLRSNSSGLNSSIDFDFCVRESFSEESSSADELFSGGKMIPSEIKKKVVPAPPKQEITSPQVDRALVQTPCVREESSKSSKKETNEGEERQSSKSFWGFKRSSSCGTGYGRTLCPLPLLSRSNSTGSADESKPINIKRPPLISKESSNSSKQNTQKSSNASNKMQSSHSHNLASSCSYQKPPLKKGHGAYGNGVSVNPVLNVPPANLFAIGSIFANGKSKNKKK